MIYVIGIGPGKLESLTFEAKEALLNCETIVGYKTYINLIKDLIKDKNIIENGMRKEIERCKKAIEIANNGQTVAVISSGDSGVYGMAGLIYELSQSMNSDIDIKVIPGVTASLAGASIIGAPLMHDFCHISLSDLLTPWDVIEKRIKYATLGDFVIVFYNPKSKTRNTNLSRAIEIIKANRKDDVCFAIIKNIFRENQSYELNHISSFDDSNVDMTSIVIIGNKTTYIHKNKMITKRGYNV